MAAWNRRRQSRHRHRRGPRHRPRHRARCWRRRARGSWSATSGRACRAPAPTRGPAQAVVDEIRKAGGEAIASTLSIAEPQECRRDRARRARGLRARRHPGQQCRHPARRHLPQDELVGLVGRDRGASARRVQHEPRLRGAFPRAELRRLRAHDLDLGPDRQFRPGQLHGGEARHHGALARHRARHGSASRCAPTASRRSPGPA